MKTFKEILELPTEEIQKLIKDGPPSDELFTALVVKKFMEKYHLLNVDTALEQFLLFKKTQSKLLSLSEAEEKALTACLKKAEENV
jgi:hypothetical protein